MSEKHCWILKECVLSLVSITLTEQIRSDRPSSPKEVKCQADCKDGLRKSLPQSPQSLLQNKKKKGREGRGDHMQAPVSFLWQPECYYSTLPFIMKGLQLVSKMGWGAGQIVQCCIFLAHSQKTGGKVINL